jgi:hypothetical protein
MEGDRNRPVHLQNTAVTPDELSEESELKRYEQLVDVGTSPQVIADHVFHAIQHKAFYILTHPEQTPLVEARMNAILQGRNPLLLAEIRTLLENPS